jgi:hypothetical protein
MDKLEAKIDSEDFKDGLDSAFNAIFEHAPNTHLLVLGYPRFWNEHTDACDQTSFKFGCSSKRVLPLIKDRRQKMNGLSTRLNERLREAAEGYSPPESGGIAYVDVDPYFEGHRFCEEGVDEPSYRNPDIWFYPLKYWTAGAMNFDANGVASGDCEAILEDGGDAGDYFACELANGVRDGGAIDLREQSNNVPGSGNVSVSGSRRSGGLPDFLARIFHPTVYGMAAYRDAIVDAYQSIEAIPEDSPYLGAEHDPKIHVALDSSPGETRSQPPAQPGDTT